MKKIMVASSSLFYSLLNAQTCVSTIPKLKFYDKEEIKVVDSVSAKINKIDLIELLIVDSTQIPLKDVYVKWNKNDFGFTDSLGKIKINFFKTDDSIFISKVGFEKKRILNNLILDSSVRKVILKYPKLEEVIVNSDFGIKGRCRCYCGSTRIRKMKPLKKQTSSSKLSISLYPNPIQRGSVLNCKIEKSGNYVLEIFDILGKLYMTKHIYNETNSTQPIQLQNNMSAGNYFVKLNNIITKESITEKIIIQ